MTRIRLLLLVGIIVSLLTGGSRLAVSEAASLKELVEGARKEGQLNVTLTANT